MSACRRLAALVFTSSAPRFLTTAARATEPEVLAETLGSMRTLVLNRPKALNALTLGMVRSILEYVKEWQADKDVKVVAMKGVGGKAFCAGGDVVAIARSGSGALGDGGQLAQAFFREEYIADYALASLTKPYVALLDGITMGGGVGVSIHGRFRVATEKTLFAMPETAIGLFPDVGGSFFLPRLPGSVGMYLALTGARLKGEEVFRAGIATHFVPSASLPALEQRLGEAQTEDAVRAALDAAHKGTAGPALGEVRAAVDQCFGADSVEGIITQLEKLSTPWAAETLQIMRRMSPVSMKVTHEQLKRGKSMSLADCLAMEYRITQHCMMGKDFYEGIRAVLVDKDQKPVWTHRRVEDVTAAEVAAHFAAVPNELVLTQS